MIKLLHARQSFCSITITKHNATIRGREDVGLHDNRQVAPVMEKHRLADKKAKEASLKVADKLGAI